jgi:pilus assembly protein Flp/PilA
LKIWRGKLLCSFLADESGATAIEYGLIAALVAVGLIVALSMLGNNLSTQFNFIGKTIMIQSAVIQDGGN